MKQDKNITIRLEFQDIPDTEKKGLMFMAVHGCVIKRKVDKQGIEVYDNEGKVVHERADFVMTAEQLQKGLSDIIRQLADQALKLQHEKDSNKETSTKGGIKSPFKGIFKKKGNKDKEDE